VHLNLTKTVGAERPEMVHQSRKKTIATLCKQQQSKPAVKSTAAKIGTRAVPMRQAVG